VSRGGLSAEEAIRAVAPMASLALALLAFFTNMRREALAEYRKKVPRLSCQTVTGALPDLLLALFTAAAVGAMAPLCFDAFDFGEVGRMSGSVSSVFALVWLGFAVLLLFQMWMLASRVVEALKAGN
jgi:hypothetical protein